MFKFFLIVVVVGGVVLYVLRRRNIQIGLSPSGQNVLLMAVERIIQALLRRIGL
ncbi:MAG: hypothetical protein HQL91_01025 [Magnetococcales bacterium]|nr:hypothetical protein [Magnetococcales bacterium]